MNRRWWLCLAILAAPLSAVGQAIDFGDDSSEWANDGECDDPRFEGPGAYSSPLDEDRFRDASDCLALFDSGQVGLVGYGPDYFGALAIGEDLGYGGVVSAVTQAEADYDALSECGSVDSGCSIVARFGADTCVAVARDDEAGLLGWATGPDSQETTDAAIDECMAEGGSACSAWDFACNGATASTNDSIERERFVHAMGEGADMRHLIVRELDVSEPVPGMQIDYDTPEQIQIVSPLHPPHEYEGRIYEWTYVLLTQTFPGVIVTDPDLDSLVEACETIAQRVGGVDDCDEGDKWQRLREHIEERPCAAFRAFEYLGSERDIRMTWVPDSAAASFDGVIEILESMRQPDNNVRSNIIVCLSILE